jgi:prepilin-type N-terminal cleavage/methylation domain-containing protein
MSPERLWLRLPTNPGRVNRGMSLIEVMIALSLSTVLLIGLHSSIHIALRSMPSADGAVQSSLQAQRIMDGLATELEATTYVTELTATSIGFAVADRNGDGFPERIRYAWTGTPGGGLTRQYNGGEVETIANNVDQLNLTPSSKSVAETYPSTGVEDVAESLLIDYYGTSGTGNNDVTVTNWFGQHFTMTLPAGSYAWRPTRVEFFAKKNSAPGMTSVQMRPVTATLAPASNILGANLMMDSTLTTSYAWQSYSFPHLEPISSGGGICLVLQHTLGSKSATLQGTSAFPGLQKTSNSGVAWDYDSGKCLVSRLYGKQIRSAGTKSLNSTYLTSVDIALRMTTTSPTLRCNVAMLNHPESLSGKWELKFDQNPTSTDINGDGAGDWVVNGGGSFNMATLVGGAWLANGTQLKTYPDSNFSETTIVDVKFQNTSVGGNGATFTMNALRSGSTCVPILAYLKKQADGTQTLTLSTKINDFIPKTLLNITGLANQPVLLHLIIDPATSSVAVSVNDVQHGNYALTPFSSMDGS